MVMTTALDLDQVLERILDQLERLVPYDSAAVFLEQDGHLRVVGGKGLPPEAYHSPDGFDLQNPLFQEIQRTGRPLILTDAQADPRFEAWMRTDYVHGWIGAPLIMLGHTLGFLTIDHRRPGAYSLSDGALAEAFASQAAIAIENARLFQHAQQLAITDPLTGLFNRRHFFNLGESELERSRRYDRPLALILWDVDHFKLANDTYGHLAGDMILHLMAERCGLELREADILARYGGEEFAILLPETDLEEALMVAGRLRRTISETPFLADGRSITLTVSVGVTARLPADAMLQDLLRRADQALYTAKDAGRDCVMAG
jgi:diguanylate cyclase (GGDEF)-like protein